MSDRKLPQAEGLLFLGYPYLSELAQRPEYRVISETIADDATRKWIDFEVTGAENEESGAREERQRDERDLASELVLAHLAQIEALTGPYTSEEAVLKFAEAAWFRNHETESAFATHSQMGWSAAAAVWTVGSAPLSLFAYLPACGCPVQARAHGHLKNDMIPVEVDKEWRPSRAVLEAFARIQQQARLP
jgi:hypothetical protein